MPIYSWRETLSTIDRWRHLVGKLLNIAVEYPPNRLEAESKEVVDRLAKFGTSLRFEIRQLTTNLMFAAEERNITAQALYQLAYAWNDDVIESAKIVVAQLEVRMLIEGNAEEVVNDEAAAKAALATPQPKQKKRGRPKGSLKNDPKKDAKIYRDWKATDMTIAEFCRKRRIDEYETRLAIDRHKKVRRIDGN